MPRRTRPVDYPQVHRPSTLPTLGLVPPQDGTGSRFSWQEQAVDSSESKDTVRENRQSTVPPLPVLPDHLGHAQPINGTSNGHGTALQQHIQSHYPVIQQQSSNFRPDLPRIYQQQFSQQPASIPSYEASQAQVQPHYIAQPVVQTRAVYPAQHDPRQTHAVGHVPASANAVQRDLDQHQSSEAKQEEPARAQRSVHVAPDHNPLSHTAAISPVSPSNTNLQIFPPPTATTFAQTPPQSRKGGTWRYGLASCSEPTTCFSSMFCPCMVYGRTQHRLALKSARKDPTNMLGYSAVNGSCVAWSLLCGVNILLTAIQRARIRKAYEMDVLAGNVATDCLTSICCCCCIIAQDDKEMRFREETTRVQDTTVAQAYTSPGAMTFSPQS